MLNICIQILNICRELAPSQFVGSIFTNAVMLILLAWMPSKPATAEDWVITDFVGIEVEEIPTSSSEVESFEIAPTQQLDLYEQSLRQAAEHYSNAAFKDPPLAPRNPDGTIAGFFELPLEDAGAYYPIACEEYPTPVLALKALSDRGLNEFEDILYAHVTAKHELFHAIQHGYEWITFDGEYCRKPRRWILEGMAEAAASMLGELAFGKNDSHFDLDRFVPQNFYGLRPYHIPLAPIGDTWVDCLDACGISVRASRNRYKDFEEFLVYATNSFWRHIMERMSGRQNESYSSESLQVLSHFMSTQPFGSNADPGSNQQVEAGWVDWVAGILDKHHGPFQYVYGEFATEFAAWPVSKYVLLDEGQWLRKAFLGCIEKRITPQTLTSGHSNELTVRFRGFSGNTRRVDPLSARCLDITVSGFKNEMLLHIEAKATSDAPGVSDVDLVDQLVLGLAWEDRLDQGNPIDSENCYAAAEGAGPGEFKCLYFGKVGQWLDDNRAEHLRSWRFEPVTFDEGSVRRIMVLSNVKPGNPSETLAIEDLTLNVSVSTVSSHNKTGFRVPMPLDTGTIPDLTTPKRDLLYGIGSGGAMSGIYPLDMAPFQVRWEPERGLQRGNLQQQGDRARVIPANFTQALGEFETEQTEGITYSVMPGEVVSFGQLGPVFAIVDAKRDTEGALPVLNTLCAGAEDLRPVTILQSDEAALRMHVQTPLCGTLTGDMTDCLNGCPVVDQLDIVVSLGGGWRHFGANRPRDVVTPGVRADIDRYHNVVFGEPLNIEPLPDLDNVPPGGFPAPQPVSPVALIDTSPQCDCSCEALAEFETLQANPIALLRPDNQSFIQCMPECMPSFAQC